MAGGPGKGDVLLRLTDYVKSLVRLAVDDVSSEVLAIDSCKYSFESLWLGFGLGEYIQDVIVLLSIAPIGIGMSIKTFRWE